MAYLQNQFIKFHNAIRLDFDSNAPLRKKRDEIIKDLKIGLKKIFLTNAPKFKHFIQGSYDLATGIRPIGKDDYDIDVGIVFDFSKNADQPGPFEVKEWVQNALKARFRKVRIRRPCVRVQYTSKGKNIYHIDLAIYSNSNKGNWLQNNYYIAKGFSGSSDDKKKWEISEPFQLKKIFRKKYSSLLDRDQFRRIIRYLKRWKDVNFSSSSKGKPTGIALTACCYEMFSVQKIYDWETRTHLYSDLDALLYVVRGIVNRFGWNDRITINLPVQPYNNLFERMTDVQMKKLKEKFIHLRDMLASASNEKSITIACKMLRKVFGQDFPAA